MTNRSKNLSRKKKFAFYLVIFLIPLIAISTIYAAYTAYRARSLYGYVKSRQRGWTGKVHRPDAELGFAPVADSQGAEIFPIGADIPMRYDKDGFRVPLQEGGSVSLGHPVVLALGCSFTYGAATPAENTYPYLVGKYLEGTSKNAGVSSYGLSQMIILARKLTPAYKPDFLLVQYSPWLIDRAQSPFAPAYFGKIPTPYFFMRDKQLELYPPVFQTAILDLPIDRYRTTEASISDKVSFLWHVGFPLLIHDDFNMFRYAFNKSFGAVPGPAADPEQIDKYVYEEIAKVAKANGVKLVIVALGSDVKPVQIPESFSRGDAIIVNAQNALLQRLPIINQDMYEKSYYHWRGSPLTLVDSHPNENAHRIIAEEIVRAIRNASEADANRPR